MVSKKVIVRSVVSALRKLLSTEVLCRVKAKGKVKANGTKLQVKDSKKFVSK